MYIFHINRIVCMDRKYTLVINKDMQKKKRIKSFLGNNRLINYV